MPNVSIDYSQRLARLLIRNIIEPSLASLIGKRSQTVMTNSAESRCMRDCGDVTEGPGLGSWIGGSLTTY